MIQIPTDCGGLPCQCASCIRPLGFTLFHWSTVVGCTETRSKAANWLKHGCKHCRIWNIPPPPQKKNGLVNVFGKETCFFGLKDTLSAFGVNVCHLGLLCQITRLCPFKREETASLNPSSSFFSVKTDNWQQTTINIFIKAIYHMTENPHSIELCSVLRLQGLIGLVFSKTCRWGKDYLHA